MRLTVAVAGLGRRVHTGIIWIVNQGVRIPSGGVTRIGIVLTVGGLCAYELGREGPMDATDCMAQARFLTKKKLSLYHHLETTIIESVSPGL
jgi:hypothetical protein